MTCLFIQITCGLIGQKQLGSVGQCPGDGDTLFLATGEFGGTVVGPVGESHEFESGFHPGPALGAAEGLQKQGKFDVLVSGKDWDEVVELEDVAHMQGTPPREPGAGKGPEVLCVDDEFPAAGSVNTGDEIEQGGLPGTGWSHEGEKLAPGDFEAQVLQGRDEVGALAEGLGQIADLDEGGGHVKMGVLLERGNQEGLVILTRWFSSRSPKGGRTT